LRRRLRRVVLVGVSMSRSDLVNDAFCQCF
jgi:hypothetical protein